MSTAEKVCRPVVQRSITRPPGERRTELTDRVPETPVGVTRPSSRTRKRSRPSRQRRVNCSVSENVPSGAIGPPGVMFAEAKSPRRQRMR